MRKTNGASSSEPVPEEVTPADGNGHSPALSSDDAFADLDAIKFDLTDMLAVYSERFEHIAVRRPHKQTVFRIHQSYEQSGAIYKDETTGDTYFVMPPMRRALIDYIKPALLVFGMTAQKVPFIWDLSVPREESGFGSGWAESAGAAAMRARVEWVSILADRALGVIVSLCRRRRFRHPRGPAVR